MLHMRIPHDEIHMRTRASCCVWLHNDMLQCLNASLLKNWAKKHHERTCRDAFQEYTYAQAF
jgi:hypothetical protein